jgi:hypothetical protein
MQGRAALSASPCDRLAVVLLVWVGAVGGTTALAFARILALAPVVARLAAALTFTRILAFAGVFIVG